MTDPKKATIGDLFRLMTDMRGEMTEMRSDLTSVKETVEGHTSELVEIRKTLEVQTGELEAIRNVVDNDLAGQGQVIQLEGKLTDVHKTMRQIGRELRGTTARLDRAGIPA